MPVVSLDKSICPHNGMHPSWIGRGGKPVAVCLMPEPYLRNCIRMLAKSIQKAYMSLGVNAGRRHQLKLRDIAEDENQLNILTSEMKRRQGVRIRD